MKLAKLKKNGRGSAKKGAYEQSVETLLASRGYPNPKKKELIDKVNSRPNPPYQCISTIPTDACASRMAAAVGANPPTDKAMFPSAKSEVRIPLRPDGTVPYTTPIPLRLDLGCGPGKKPGFIGVDQTAFPGVDVVHDLTKTWPWETSSVEEVHSSHCLEHFDAMERVHFLNELYRVLKPGAKATIICPHWASCRAYGDPTHKWPPVSEFAFFYWKKDWRMANAPHTDAANLKGGFNCNFEVTWGYSLEPGVAMRNQEYQQMAMTYYKEACQDCIATLTALK